MIMRIMMLMIAIAVVLAFIGTWMLFLYNNYTIFIAACTILGLALILLIIQMAIDTWSGT